MDWVFVGEVTNYFDRIGVVSVQLSESLAIGDQIAFVQYGDALFEQEVASMQIDRMDIEYAGGGEEIGLQVAQKVKVGTEVYKAVETAN